LASFISRMWTYVWIIVCSWLVQVVMP
jgi:hypothetical protein